MKNELKAIVIDKIRALLFPDFTNKLTWAVAVFGISAATIPVEFQVYFFNWIIAVLNLSDIAPLELPLLTDRNETWPYLLIIFALAHNLGYKALSRFGGIELDRARELREHDKALYQKFIDLLPTEGRTVQLIKDHDFGNNFFKQSIDPIDNLIYPWKGAEYCFNNSEVEASKVKLIEAAEQFRIKVASYTSPTRGAYLTIYPGHVDPDVDIPHYINSQIGELNSLASALYKAHQQFILLCKRRI